VPKATASSNGEETETATPLPVPGASRPEGAARWLSRFFRAVSFPEDRTPELRRFAEQGTLVYVMRSAAALNLAYFNHAYALRGIPVAKVVQGLGDAPWRGLETPHTRRVDSAELATAVLAGEHAMMFLRHTEVFGSRRGTPHAEDPFPELVRRVRESGQRVFLVPQVLVWSRHPGRLQGGVIDALLGTPDSPNLLRTAGAFLYNYRTAFAKIGTPIDLKAFLKEQANVSDALVARKVRGSLWQHLAREARVVRGPQLKTSGRVEDEVLRDRKLKHALESVAAEEKVPAKELEGKARSDLREIAAHYSPTAIEVLKPVLDVVFNRIYDGIEVDARGMERLKRAAATSSLVLCPSHKSHIDYLILSKVLYDAGMTPPHIAAGANLSFFPLGPIFRRGGAFFLRRSFKGDKLYGAVFRAYVKRLMHDGFSQEFFIEGGRSRTGKVLSPKLGLLSMEVDAWLEGASQDVSFVPIAIDYEKIVEGKEYASELAGGEKRKEDIGGLLRTPQVLRSRYGRIYIQVDEPVSLRDFMRERHLDPEKHTPEQRRTLVQVLAHRIVWGISRSATLTPAALVSAAVLAHRQRGLSSQAMGERIEFLRNTAERGGARLSRVLYEAPSDPLSEGPIREALELLCKDGSIRRSTAFGETYFSPDDDHRSQLCFYKNNLLQHFVASALVAASVLSFRDGPPQLAEARERTLWLSRLFKFEFVYRVDATFEQIFDETVEACVAFGLLERPNSGTLQPASIVARDRLELLRDLIRDFVEGYWVAAEALEELKNGAELDTRELVRRALERGRAAFLAGGIGEPEALSRPSLENAVQSFKDLGLVEAVGEKKVRLTDAARNDPARLRDLGEQIRRFL
jgi:glycerol-3-phosphate O-acyltransferase